MSEPDPSDPIDALIKGKLKEWNEGNEGNEGNNKPLQEYLLDKNCPLLYSYSALLGKELESRPSILGAKVEVDSEEATKVLPCNWNGFHFKNCDFILLDSRQRFTNCSFENCRFGSERRLYETQDGVRGIQFDNCYSISDCVFTNSTVVIAHKSIFSDCEFSDKTFSNWSCTDCDFDTSLFEAASLSCSLFEGVSFATCRFRVDAITQVRWEDVRFSDSSLTISTEFEECHFNSIFVDDRFLESLGPKRGELGGSELARFSVSSPLTEMRLLFGGWKATVHWIAVTLFLIPYLLFSIEKFWGPLPTIGMPVVSAPATSVPTVDANDLVAAARQFEVSAKEVTKAKEQDSVGKVRFGIVLWDFIKFGNHEGEDRTWFLATYKVATFFLFLLYNGCRLLFLLKVKTLEHGHAVQGFWSLFEFSDFVHPKYLKVKWSRLKFVAEWGVVLAVVCGLVHFTEILQKKVVP